MTEFVLASVVQTVSNSDNTLTISPTTGAVVASLNLSHANSWAAVQTFANNISFGGATLDVGKSTSLVTGDIIYYDGTNWINLAIGSTGYLLTVASGKPSWAVATSTHLNSRLTSPVPTANGTKSTGLTISLSASTNYAFKAYIYLLTGGTTPAVNFQIHTLASGAALSVVMGLEAHYTGSSATQQSHAITSVTANIFSANFNINSQVYIVQLYGVITVGGTPTTLQIDVVDTETTANIETGSFVDADPIS